MCWVSFPVWLMNGQFKTIFWVEQYHLEVFCVPGDPNNEHAESLSNHHWPTTISRPSSKHNSTDSKDLHVLGDLNREVTVQNITLYHSIASTISGPSSNYNPTNVNSYVSGRPQQWLWRVSSTISPTNDHFKTIFQVQLYSLKDLCPGRLHQQPCIVFTQTSPSSGLPFQDIFQA